MLPTIAKLHTFKLPFLEKLLIRQDDEFSSQWEKEIIVFRGMVGTTGSFKIAKMKLTHSSHLKLNNYPDSWSLILIRMNHEFAASLHMLGVKIITRSRRSDSKLSFTYQRSNKCFAWEPQLLHGSRKTFRKILT